MTTILTIASSGEIFSELESERVELKTSVPRNDQIVKTAIAFCNGFGGRTVIGVSDDRRIIGVLDEQAAQLAEILPKLIYDSCTPPILPSCYLHRIGSKRLVIIEVDEGGNKPYFITSEGLSNGTYIRLGTSTVRATGAVLEELLWTGAGNAADAYPVRGSSEKDLDATLLADFFSKKRFRKRSGPIPSAFISRNALASLGPVSGDHYHAHSLLIDLLLPQNLKP